MYEAQFLINRRIIAIKYNQTPLRKVIEEMSSRHTNFTIYDKLGEIMYSKKESST